MNNDNVLVEGSLMNGGSAKIARLKTWAASTLALAMAAPLLAQSQVTLTVTANMDLYRAGGYKRVMGSLRWSTASAPEPGGA